VIPQYLEALSAALSYDPSLSRCVRQEVEDHLYEAVAADPGADRTEAQRRAIANFGAPHVIAAQFAVVSLARRARSIGTGVIVAIAAVFVVMKARVAWLAAMPWAVCDDLREASHIALSIDRYAFWFAMIAGIAGWLYIDRSSTPALPDPGYRKQIRRCFFVCAAATAALVVSVICDGVLTAFRLLGQDMSVEYLIPIITMAIEAACAGALAWQLRHAIRAPVPGDR
jgi:hypothetical protein